MMSKSPGLVTLQSWYRWMALISSQTLCLTATVGLLAWLGWNAIVPSLALSMNFQTLMLCVSAITTMITLTTPPFVILIRGLAVKSIGMCLWDYVDGWQTVAVKMSLNLSGGTNTPTQNLQTKAKQWSLLLLQHSIGVAEEWMIQTRFCGVVGQLLVHDTDFSLLVTPVIVTYLNRLARDMDLLICRQFLLVHMNQGMVWNLLGWGMGAPLYHSYYKELVRKPGKLQRFMLEGPRPCTIFCFVLTHLGWIA